MYSAMYQLEINYFFSDKIYIEEPLQYAMDECLLIGGNIYYLSG